MDPSLSIEQVLEKARKTASQAEVFHLHHKHEPVRFEANRLKSLERKESSGFALRLIKGGKIGFSSSTIQDKIDNLVENAVEAAPYGPITGMKFPTYRNFTPVNIYDPAVESYPIDNMIQFGQTMIDQIREFESKLLCDAVVSKDVIALTLLNSQGGYANYRKTVFSASIGGTLITDTDMLTLWEGKSSCHPLDYTSAMVQSIQTQLEYGRNVAPPITGDVPAVFTPHGVAATLISPLMAGFNGKSVMDGSSPLVEKLGEEVIDNRITISDQPTMPFTPGSRMCDDEGIPTHPMHLIDQGVIKNFLYDLQTADQAGVSSTGNAHRGITRLPSPGTSVTVVSDGTTSFDDMIADVPEGIVVERLLGAGQSNILGGEFSANVLLGYKVEKGRIIGRLKNTVINGNVYDVLRNIEALGNDAQLVGGSLKTPSIYSTRVSVATRD